MMMSQHCCSRKEEIKGVVFGSELENITRLARLVGRAISWFCMKEKFWEHNINICREGEWKMLRHFFLGMTLNSQFSCVDTFFNVRNIVSVMRCKQKTLYNQYIQKIRGKKARCSPSNVVATKRAKYSSRHK